MKLCGHISKYLILFIIFVASNAIVHAQVVREDVPTVTKPKKIPAPKIPKPQISRSYVTPEGKVQSRSFPSGLEGSAYLWMATSLTGDNQLDPQSLDGYVTRSKTDFIHQLQNFQNFVYDRWDQVYNANFKAERLWIERMRSDHPDILPGLHSAPPSFIIDKTIQKISEGYFDKEFEPGNHDFFEYKYASEERWLLKPTSLQPGFAGVKDQFETEDEALQRWLNQQNAARTDAVTVNSSYPKHEVHNSADSKTSGSGSTLSESISKKQWNDVETENPNYKLSDLPDGIPVEIELKTGESLEGRLKKYKTFFRIQLSGSNDSKPFSPQEVSSVKVKVVPLFEPGLETLIYWEGIARSIRVVAVDEVWTKVLWENKVSWKNKELSIPTYQFQGFFFDGKRYPSAKVKLPVGKKVYIVENGLLPPRPGIVTKIFYPWARVDMLNEQKSVDVLVETLLFYYQEELKNSNTDDNDFNPRPSPDARNFKTSSSQNSREEAYERHLIGRAMYISRKGFPLSQLGIVERVSYPWAYIRMNDDHTLVLVPVETLLFDYHPVLEEPATDDRDSDPNLFTNTKSFKVPMDWNGKEEIYENYLNRGPVPEYINRIQQIPPEEENP